jgi:uncharacterized protein (DUF305 family)
MKQYIQKIMSKLNAFNLFLGFIFGAALSVFMFSVLVPSDNDRMFTLSERNLYNSMKVRGYTMFNEHHVGMNTAMGDNSYMMGKITSENQFLREMVLHHNAAVVMARQVLALNPTLEVRDLADRIIQTQTEEIETMKKWIVKMNQ